jgi:flagellin-like protein
MRKRRDKRGISPVITTLIIILLALVAIGIVWIVIKNIVSEGTEGISLGKFTLDLEIKQALLDNESASVNVKRNPGVGDISKINFIFENGTNSQVIEKEVTLRELETKNFIFSLPIVMNLEKDVLQNLSVVMVS